MQGSADQIVDVASMAVPSSLSEKPAPPTADLMIY
jgi:hypothetical protein